MAKNEDLILTIDSDAEYDNISESFEEEAEEALSVKSKKKNNNNKKKKSKAGNHGKANLEEAEADDDDDDDDDEEKEEDEEEEKDDDDGRFLCGTPFRNNFTSCNDLKWHLLSKNSYKGFFGTTPFSSSSVLFKVIESIFPPSNTISLDKFLMNNIPGCEINFE